MTQAVAQGGEAATGQSAIDEIIVTANKREQSLQDTGDEYFCYLSELTQLT